MSVSAIFPSSPVNQANSLQNVNQQRPTEFQQLTQALQSGNLTNALHAFGVLSKSATSAGIQLTTDLTALGSALQSGDLAGARDAYSAVQQGSHNSNPIEAHHHRAHHGGGGLRLTSGFPDSGGQSDPFQPVNLSV
jgi:hypothetical protein